MNNLNPEPGLRTELLALRPAMVLAATMMGVVLVTLDVSVVNVAVASLHVSFDVRIDGLQWVLNVYTLAYATFLLSAGGLGDRFGARGIFLIGFVIFTASSAACGLAPSFTALLGARVLQGIGAALLVPSAMALLQGAFPDARERASAIGLWAGAGSFALAAGPVIGGGSSHGSAGEASSWSICRSDSSASG